MDSLKRHVKNYHADGNFLPMQHNKILFKPTDVVKGANQDKGFDNHLQLPDNNATQDVSTATTFSTISIT